MASLLSPQDIAAAQNALEDVMDTFFTLPITLIRITEKKPDRWNTGTHAAVRYELNALYEQSSNQTDVAQVGATGVYDDSDGLFSLSFKALDAAGLVANGLPAINPATDTIEAQGKVYDILGVHPDGFLVERYELVKLIVKLSPRTV